MKRTPTRRSLQKSWANFREHLNYRIDQIFAGSSFSQLALLACVTVMVILLGMSAYFFGLFDKSNSEVPGIGRQIDQGLFDAMWWSAKHIFDPSFFDSNYGATWPIVAISLMMAVIGMSLFATLLSFITGGIEARMASLRKGNSPVKESGHLLILGWNDKVFSILDLLEDKCEDEKVVILSPLGIEEMKELLRVRSKQFRHVRVILRSGIPTNAVELRRVAYDSAYNIIVLADESSVLSRGSADIQVIMALMLLSANREWQNAPPKMVAEVKKNSYLHIAEIAGDNKVSLVCSSTIVAKIIVQTSRQPGLARVYAELFGFAGNEIYVREFPDCAGLLFADLRACFPNAVPIGISRTRSYDGVTDFDHLLNPEAGYVVGPGEWMILVARDDQITFDANAKATPVSLTQGTPLRRQHDEQVVILGWNDRLYGILQEFDNYMTGSALICVAASHTHEHAMNLIKENLKKPLTHVRVEYVKTDTTKPNGLAQLPIELADHLIILADESILESDPDSRTIMTSLLLRNRLRHLPETRGVRIVAEVINSENCELLQGERDMEFIVSPMIVSMLLAQIAQQLMLKAIYEDLLNAGGNEIYLKPARNYSQAGGDCSFTEVATAAINRQELAIGFKIASESADGGRSFGIYINPPRERRFVLTEEDKVIVIAQDLYDVT